MNEKMWRWAKKIEEKNYILFRDERFELVSGIDEHDFFFIKFITYYYLRWN